MGYVFFDTETTGLDAAFDQIVHFAAVRTDHDLNELGRFELRSRLQPHVVPHPGALRANGLPIARLNDAGLPSHYAMVCEIRRRLIAWSPSIFVGFNSIGFDEYMLRQGLFQSLWPAYLTSQHQNGRADAYGLVQTACALSPGSLIVPTKPDGRPCFKLDQLAPANGVAHAGAVQHGDHRRQHLNHAHDIVNPARSGLLPNAVDLRAHSGQRDTPAQRDL